MFGLGTQVLSGGGNMKSSQKKSYVTPAITTYGTLEKLTQKFGTEYIDVPQGTSVNNAGPGGVAGDGPFY